MSSIKVTKALSNVPKYTSNSTSKPEKMIGSWMSREHNGIDADDDWTTSCAVKHWWEREGAVRGGERSKRTMCFVGTGTFNRYGGGYSGWYITANHWWVVHNCRSQVILYNCRSLLLALWSVGQAGDSPYCRCVGTHVHAWFIQHDLSYWFGSF